MRTPSKRALDMKIVLSLLTTIALMALVVGAGFVLVWLDLGTALSMAAMAVVAVLAFVAQFLLLSLILEA